MGIECRTRTASGTMPNAAAPAWEEPARGNADGAMQDKRGGRAYVAVGRRESNVPCCGLRLWDTLCASVCNCFSVCASQGQHTMLAVAKPHKTPRWKKRASPCHTYLGGCGSVRCTGHRRLDRRCAVAAAAVPAVDRRHLFGRRCGRDAARRCHHHVLQHSTHRRRRGNLIQCTLHLESAPGDRVRHGDTTIAASQQLWPKRTVLMRASAASPTPADTKLDSAACAPLLFNTFATAA